MIAFSLGSRTVGEALRAVRALGAHRYVSGRLHLVHALAFAALGETTRGAGASSARELLAGHCSWADAVLCEGRADPASRDEALWRRCSDAELVELLASFWSPGDGSCANRDRLRSLLVRFELPADGEAPFDEAAEGDMHPLLVDAGWELVPLSALDPQMHKGAIGAFGDALAFESARFEEETAIPQAVHLYELPAIGPAELLRGADEGGVLAEPLVVWADGNATYIDYVVRGVRRAAGLTERD